jgi:hypothetical protein
VSDWLAMQRIMRTKAVRLCAGDKPLQDDDFRSTRTGIQASLSPCFLCERHCDVPRAVHSQGRCQRERHGRALIFKAIFRLDEWVRPGFRKSGIEMSAIPERERKVKPWSRALSAR